MAWVRIDDQFPDHPKVLGLSNDAFCLHVTAMCWSAKQLTDGKVPSHVLKRLAWRCHDAAMATDELVASGVWEVDDPRGWIIHDFLDYNPSKDEALALSEKRSEAGRAGASARWQNDSKPHGKSHSKPHGKTMPPSPSPMNHDDDEIENPDDLYTAALREMETLGLWTKDDRDRFRDMWPELFGREDWVGRAITIARDNAKGAKLKYALKVLANAIHTGVAPGETSKTNGKAHDATIGPNADYDALKRKYGDTDIEDSPYADAVTTLMQQYAAADA